DPAARDEDGQQLRARDEVEERLGRGAERRALAKGRAGTPLEETAGPIGAPPREALLLEPARRTDERRRSRRASAKQGEGNDHQVPRGRPPRTSWRRSCSRSR